MLSLDQIRRELRAIREFDALFFDEPVKQRDDSMSFLIRQARKLELLWFLEGLAAKN